MMILGVTDWFLPRAHPRRQKVSSQGLLCGLSWPFAASTLLRFGVEIVRGVPASPVWRPGRLIFARLQVAAVAGAHLFHPGPHLSGGQPYQGAERGIILA